MEAKGYCMRTVHGSQVTGSEKSMACLEAEKCCPFFWGEFISLSRIGFGNGDRC